MAEDVRWEQRFSNFTKALLKLEKAVLYINQNLMIQIHESQILENVLDEIIKDGLIQRFEYTHELAWNVMKYYAEYQGNSEIGGSRDATREAFQLQLISNGQIWMDMINSRNKSSHTYNEATANEIYSKIISEYFPEFLKFKVMMDAKMANGTKTIFDK
jgi:nucleotidyltransferase substrate binding protein (TIGR01987 family)